MPTAVDCGGGDAHPHPRGTQDERSTSVVVVSVPCCLAAAGRLCCCWQTSRRVGSGPFGGISIGTWRAQTLWTPRARRRRIVASVCCLVEVHHPALPRGCPAGGPPARCRRKAAAFTPLKNSLQCDGTKPLLRVAEMCSSGTRAVKRAPLERSGAPLRTTFEPRSSTSYSMPQQRTARQ